MNELPRPQHGSSPFGSPQTGWSTPGSPLVSPPTGSGGRPMLIAALVGVIVIGGAIAFFAFGGDSADETANDSIAEAEAIADSALAEAEGALSDAEGALSAVDASVEQLQDATENIATIPLDSVAPAEAPVATTVAPVTAPPPTQPPAPVSLFDGDHIGGIVDDIATAREADPLRVLRLVVYPEYIISEVQDPNIPENVDQYIWRGQLADPTPVKLVGNGELEPNLFTSSEVNWSAIPALIASAPAAVGIDDGVVSHVIVHRNLPFSDDITMRVFVSGQRTDGYVDADANGVITAVSEP